MKREAETNHDLERVAFEKGVANRRNYGSPSHITTMLNSKMTIDKPSSPSVGQNMRSPKRFIVKS